MRAPVPPRPFPRAQPRRLPPLPEHRGQDRPHQHQADDGQDDPPGAPGRTAGGARPSARAEQGPVNGRPRTGHGVGPGRRRREEWADRGRPGGRRRSIVWARRTGRVENRDRGTVVPRIGGAERFARNQRLAPPLKGRFGREGLRGRDWCLGRGGFSNRWVTDAGSRGVDPRGVEGLRVGQGPVDKGFGFNYPAVQGLSHPRRGDRPEDRFLQLRVVIGVTGGRPGDVGARKEGGNFRRRKGYLQGSGDLRENRPAEGTGLRVHDRLVRLADRTFERHDSPRSTTEKESRKPSRSGPVPPSVRIRGPPPFPIRVFPRAVRPAGPLASGQGCPPARRLP